ncbi:MAG TPA: tetratricopeptide repeat protein [Terriglobales bacterium]|nr:tetratricopeptide repeat protein [Terriglobales bacterium]
MRTPAGFADSRTSFSAISDVGFHLHPHYRAKLPIETTLLKTQTGLDDFITEKYQDIIARILEQWRASLMLSSSDASVIGTVLAPDFLGCPFQPVQSHPVRSGPVEVWQNRFENEVTLGRDAFLVELRSTISAFSEILIAEFQVVNIESVPGPSSTINLKTRVRYELVGTGQDFYREQRIGEWDMEWRSTSSMADKFRLRKWKTLNETRSRSFAPSYMDIAAQALSGNASYDAQLLHGADYWRTVLDGACGIDIYGNNGISVGDIDNDGYDDLYICQPAGLPNRLYRNRGDGTFEDITEKSGLGILDNTSCALFADFDNNGRQDLIVVSTNGPLLFSNQGDGKFLRKADAFKFAVPPQGTFTGAAVADYDRDGWLDVYFCLYLYYQGTDQYNYPSPYYAAENGPPNFLMRNNRDGSFRDVTSGTGLNKNNSRYSFCCGWSDFNGNGWPDLYVVNDFGRKNLYRNNGDGTFTDIASQAGVEDVGAGMSVCCFDYDNDGAEDIYVANMWTAAGQRIAMQPEFEKDAPEDIRALFRKHAMGNSLFRNTGKDTFRDATGPAGMSMGRWSWSSDAWDFDHDGFLDLYVTNGMVSGPSRPTPAEDLNSFFWRQVVANSPVKAQASHHYELGWNALNELIRSDHTWSGFERNIFYANNLDGTFSDVSGVAGLDFLEDGRAFALTDFNHDGRLEVFLKNRNGPQLRVLQNVMQKLPPSIAFHLRGTKSNRDSIGAVVNIECAGLKQTRMLQAGSGFLSQHSKEVFFGLGEAKGPVHASIRWPSGLVQEFQDLPVNHRISVEEGSVEVHLEPFKARTPQGLKPKSIVVQSGMAKAMPFHNSSLKRADSQKAESQETSWAGTEPLPVAVETWLLAPISAPDFSLVDLKGKTQSLTALRGRPVLLNFWVTQSATCQDNLKVFSQLHQRWSRQGLQLLTVNVDDSSDPAKLRVFVRERQFLFPVLPASDDVAGIYNILNRYLFDRHRDMGLPTSFLINNKGDIVKVYQGRIRPEQVENDLQNIPQTLAERLAKALPFPGVTDASVFQRNNLSLGAVYFQREYFDQAEASFRLALRDDPSSAEAFYGLGSVYLKQEKTAEARESFERATEAHASYPDTSANAWNNLGLLAMRESRSEEAIQYFQEALRKASGHLIALNNLGNAYRQQKRWDDAREVLERAVQVSPQDPEANYSLGMVFAQLNDIDRAYEYLQKALKFRPDYPEALNNLGILYLRTQRRDEAVTSFEKCIRVAPSFDQSYINLARIYAIENTPEKARAVLQDLLKEHPDHPVAQKMLEQLKQ